MAELTVLKQLEKIGELVSTDFVEGNRDTAFTYHGDNLGKLISVL